MEEGRILAAEAISNALKISGVDDNDAKTLEDRLDVAHVRW